MGEVYVDRVNGGVFFRSYAAMRSKRSRQAAIELSDEKLCRRSMCWGNSTPQTSSSASIIWIAVKGESPTSLRWALGVSVCAATGKQPLVS